MYCKTCSTDKPVSEMQSGSKCKECHSDYMREYHQKWRLKALQRRKEKIDAESEQGVRQDGSNG